MRWLRRQLTRRPRRMSAYGMPPCWMFWTAEDYEAYEREARR